VKLPLVVSVPHAGTVVPLEVRDICMLTGDDIIEDGDKWAGMIYEPLEKAATKCITASVARAIVDLNRSEDDMGQDGVVKTHTIWMKPVYSRKLPNEIVEALINRYWRPYHASLSELAVCGAALGVDCHTMVEVAPPIGPAPGSPRPAVCISNAGWTCPDTWLKGLARSIESAFDTEVGINKPFKGGHIIRSHAKELPWIQIEISRGDFMSEEEKAALVLESLAQWCRKAL
jgi:N-formylglutamate amidohydrolase